MTESRNERKKVLHLLQSLPHPGKELVKFVGEGLDGFRLRPCKIPQKIAGSDKTCLVELRLMRDNEPFDERSLFSLSLLSREWEAWVSQKPGFVVRAEDVGLELEVVEARRKNFNMYLLHQYLDQVSPRITIHEDYLQQLQHEDSYTCYFWNHARSVSGGSYSSDMVKIRAAISGIEAFSAIESSGALYLNYWQFLLEKNRPYMSVLLKWHKMLVSLYHLMNVEGASIPIDFNELIRRCAAELNNCA